MARYVVDAFTTASVGSGVTLDFDRTIDANYVDIYKIKITPSGGTGTTEFWIYKAAARTAGDIIYSTAPWTDAIFYDPIEDNAGVYAERTEGFVCRYEDTDTLLQLHCSIKNNDASARTYDIEITIDDSPFAANVTGVPDNLFAEASANGLEITSHVSAQVNNATLTAAEFRAILYAPGALLPNIVDLRTVAEGGTFAHNGTTQLVITGLKSNIYGAEYRFTSSGAGRWYYAWKLQNSVGWSKWTDGNDTPSAVFQFVETSTNSDSGPPDDWQVNIEQGPIPNTIVVRATRPQTNGNIIRAWAVQLKDSSTGSWRKVDIGTGASEVHYDGSAANHDIDPATNLIHKTATTWGTAVPGDIVVMDVNGDGTFDSTKCLWGIVKVVAADNITLWSPLLPLATATMAGGIYTQIRLKIVKAPWDWDSEGYMGGWATDGGYWDTNQDKDWPGLDNATKEFVTPPIPIDPTAVTVQARVWFVNGYSIDDGDIIVSADVVGGTGLVGDGFVWNSFKDRDWWVPVIQQPAHVQITLNTDGSVKGQSATGQTTNWFGAAGVAGRFRVFPSTNGQVILRGKWLVNQLTDPGSGSSFFQMIGMIIDMEGMNNTGGGTRDLGVHAFVAQNHYHTGHKLAIGYAAKLETGGMGALIMSTTTQSEIAMPARPFYLELRLTIDEDTVNINPATVWKQFEYQISGGGWNDVTLPAPAETMYARRAVSTALRGYKPVLVYMQTRTGFDGDNATLVQFEVQKGIAARF